jgi:hypothetical protein
MYAFMQAVGMVNDHIEGVVAEMQRESRDIFSNDFFLVIKISFMSR